MLDLKDLKAKLNAYFVANSWDHDMTSGGGCDTCGYGDQEGFSIEKIQELIEKFDPEKIQ